MTSDGAGSWQVAGATVPPSTSQGSGLGTSKWGDTRNTTSSPRTLRSTWNRRSHVACDRNSSSASRTLTSSWRTKGPWRGKESNESVEERENESAWNGGMERDKEKERQRRERFWTSGDEAVKRPGEGQKELEWGFVSKGDKRLLDKKNQEKFFTEIVDRYMQFCEQTGNGGGHQNQGKNDWNRSEHGNISALRPAASISPSQLSAPPNMPPSPNKMSMKQSTQESHLCGQYVDATSAEVASLLISMRKLREGILASHRVDLFVKEVYIFFVRAAIFLRSVESYLPAIVRLLESIHLHVPLSNSELSEFAGYYMLHFACRLEDYSKAFETRKKYKIKDLRIDQAIMALIHNNYWSFRTARRKVDAYKGILMDYAEKRFRADTLKCLARAYHVLDVEYVETVTGCSWEKVREEYQVGWTADEGGKVMVRKKPRRNNDNTGE